MKLLTTIYDLNNFKELALADGFLIGNDQYATRLTHSFSIDEINRAIGLAHDMNKEIFLLANQMFDDEMIDSFKVWLEGIHLEYVTGIIVADVGNYYALKKEGLEDKLVYNPETLMTNYYDFNFLASTGIYGVYVAKEITLEDIKIISSKKQTKLFMVGHGYLNMFYSKRQLVNNYMSFIGEKNNFHNKQILKIIEEKRSKEPYPILEDNAGTHVFRSKVFDSIDYINTIESLVEYCVIDSIFESDAYAKDIILLYKGQSKLTKEAVQLKYNESWDHGFLFKKTVYKQGVSKS